MSHHRVIPRDFFNESKLLKCLGQFQLCVLDQRCLGHHIEIEYHGEPFIVRQRDSDGALYLTNYRAFFAGEELHLYIPYNSRENYPLWVNYKGNDFEVFDDYGKWVTNFGIPVEF